MAAVTLTRRQNAKASLVKVTDSDTIVVGGVERSTSGGAAIFTDANTVAITIGGGAAQTTVTIGRLGQTTRILGGLQVDEAVVGPSDGTGIVVGSVPTGASTGSALQPVSMTETQRDQLVGADGMLVYNTTALTLQTRNAGVWRDLPTQLPDSEKPGLVYLGSLLDYTGSSGASSLIQYSRVFLDAGVSVDSVEVFQVSGGGSGRTTNAGFYTQTDPLDDTLGPTTRVAESGSTATASGANGSYVTAAFLSSYIVPAAGFYWIAIVNSSSAYKVSVSLTYPANFLPIRRESTTGVTLPGTTGTLTNGSGAIAYAGARVT